MKTLISIPIALLCLYYGSLYYGFKKEPPQWNVEAPSTVTRVEGISALVGDTFYLFFGFEEYREDTHDLIGSNHVSALDTKTMTWKRMKDAPFTGSHVDLAVHGKFIFFAGGFEGNHPGPAVDNFLIYDTQNDSWEFGPRIPMKLGGGALEVVGGGVHFVSGFFSPFPEPSNEKHWRLELDDFESGWKEMKHIPVSRGHAGSATLNEKLYVIGGTYTHDPMYEDTKMVHRYDPKTNSWERVADLPYKLSHTEPGTFVYNGMIYVAGGRNGGQESLSERELADVIAYDPKTDSWQQMGFLPARLRSPAATIANGKFITATGSYFWGQEATAETWSLPCANNPICGNGEYGSFKLRLRTFHKDLLQYIPYRLQKLMRVKEVALSDMRD